MTSVHAEQDVLMQEEVATEREANYQKSQEPGQSQTEDISQQAKDISQQAKGMLDQNKERLVQRLSKIEHALREVSQRLKDDQEETLSDYGNRIAEGMTKFQRSLESRDSMSLLREVEDYGRRNPLAVVSVALLAGLVLGRVLKSSARTGENR